ncbi:MFS transporter [Kribbella jejuensis]|uniref:MFS transporter n=1 Tax=Kribbella jejuensis TaxID=236068 RepID=A0A542EQA7_9ACTN|nr:MFS transporter [Kribbella jejuensis]TQJ17523.1 MFS transporter [Kribbella jejuensis]
MGRFRLPKGPVRSLGAAGLLNSVGDGAFATISVIYLVQYVGLPAHQVAVGLTIAGAVALLVGVPLGMLGDRVGPRPVFVGLCLVEGCAVLAYGVVGGWWSFLVVAVLAATATRATAGVRNGFIAHLTTGAERLRTRAFLRSVNNTGTAIGAALGGIALLGSSEALLRLLLAGDALTFAIVAIVVGRIPYRRSRSGSVSGGLRLVVGNWPFLAASLSQGLLSINCTLLTVALPLWIVTRAIVPNETISLLVGGSTVLGILLQVPVSGLADSPRGAVRSTAAAGVLAAAACLIYMTSAGAGRTAALVLLCVGSAVRLFGELLQTSGGWSMSFSAPPPGRECTYQAVYSSAFTVATALGPLLAGWIASEPDGRGWLTAAVLFAVLGPLAAGASAAVFRDRAVT